MLQLDKDVLNEIPKIDVPGAEYTEPWVYFSNVHTKISPVRKEDYHRFIEQLETVGFEVRESCEHGIREIFYNTVLEKEGRYVYLMYITLDNSIFMSISEDPYRATWTAQEVFEKVPKMYTHENEFYTPQNYGAGNYVVEIDCTLKEDYHDYLKKLEDSGFAKFAENEEGINGTVFCANYTKDNLVLTVTYVANMKKTYVSATFDQELSEHLHYDDSYVADNEESAKTTLHMLKLDGGGNGFVWKLKNGHFLVSDGGLPCDINVLYEYLESETPEGEKPVIEGWFVTHGHADHCGPFEPISSHAEKYADRVIVEGVYYNEPSDLVFSLDPGICKGSSTLIKDALKVLKTSKGTNPVIYRTQTGQRYYFNDITVDIVLGQEQNPFICYSGNMNDSSTWCMFNVEGQKCLFGGDGDRGGMKFMMCAYDKAYMEIDLFTLLHHGLNTRDFFTDFCTVKTTLVTCLGAQKCKLPTAREKENAHLKESSREWFSWEDGTKVLTFPYAIGTYETRN